MSTLSPPPTSLLSSFLVDEDTFFIDNSRYEFIEHCLRSAEYAVVHKRISAGHNQAFSFGEAIHLALKMRYKYCQNKQVSQDFQTRQFMLLDEFFKINPAPIGDHRTLGLAQEVIEKYNNVYQQEPFDIIEHKSKLIVEEGFALPLGTIKVPSHHSPIKIVWKGRIDLAVKDNGTYWVFDNKTSQIGGDYYFASYPTSTQMKGYVFALRFLTGLDIKGAIINAIFARKPTKTGKGIEFQRAAFEYDEDTLKEWHINTLSQISIFLNACSNGFFPMASKQCVHRYGQCQYIQVCSMSPTTRLTALNSGEFKEDTFSPLHEDRLDLEKFVTAPIPTDYQRTTLQQEQLTKTADLNSIFEQLMK